MNHYNFETRNTHLVHLVHLVQLLEDRFHPQDPDKPPMQDVTPTLWQASDVRHGGAPRPVRSAAYASRHIVGYPGQLSADEQDSALTKWTQSREQTRKALAFFVIVPD
jgi:hypothetical protein